MTYPGRGIQAADRAREVLGRGSGRDGVVPEVEDVSAVCVG